MKISKKMGKLKCGAYTAPPTEKNYDAYGFEEPISIRDLIVFVLNLPEQVGLNFVRAYYNDNKGRSNDGIYIYGLPDNTLYDKDFTEPFRLNEMIYRFDIINEYGTVIHSGCVKSNYGLAFYKFDIPTGRHFLKWTDYQEVTKTVEIR